jgi:hypothetical protein
VEPAKGEVEATLSPSARRGLPVRLGKERCHDEFVTGKAGKVKSRGKPLVIRIMRAFELVTLAHHAQLSK